MPTAASKLRVFLFGCGIGESIVMEFGGRFGVIDSFRHNGLVPALALLQQTGATGLDFLGLTHPHEDHYSGMGEIFDYFATRDGVGEFWRYPALDWKNLYPVLKARIFRNAGAPIIQAQANACVNELHDFYRKLLQRPGLIIRNLEIGFHWTLWEPVSCRVLAPAGAITIQAAERLAQEVTYSDQKREPLNDYSFALHFQAMDHSIFLMGDVSKKSWICSKSDSLWPGLITPGRNVFLKASHHGSDSDNPDWLLSAIKGADSTKFAVTRYTPSGLPRSKFMARLASFDDGESHRLSEKPSEAGPSFEPECLELEITSSGVQCRRWSLDQLSALVWN